MRFISLSEGAAIGLHYKKVNFYRPNLVYVSKYVSFIVLSVSLFFKMSITTCISILVPTAIVKIIGIMVSVNFGHKVILQIFILLNNYFLRVYTLVLT